MADMVEPFRTPILLNVFNRPAETERVLSILRDLKPEKLYVHCDGPRQDNEKDMENVKVVHQLIKEGVNWPCDLHLLWQDTNLGCGQGPATAITWFFSNVEAGIILEDDCCPHPDFFHYCQQLLAHYSEDTRIGIISGAYFGKPISSGKSYHFSAYAGIWGWATWRRVWDLFDFDFYRTDEDFLAHVVPFVHSKAAANYWLKILHRCTIDGPGRSYWDYQLHLSLLYANKIHIIPNHNLVTNIGFNENATHTHDQNSRFANKPVHGILPIVFPDRVYINHKQDNKVYAPSLVRRFGRRVKQALKKFKS